MQLKFCFLCYKGVSSIVRHLKKEHTNYNLQNYYDKFFKKETDGYCLNCGKETIFNNGKQQYNIYCSNYCMKHSDVYKQRCSSGVKLVWKLRTAGERKNIGQKILETNKKDPNFINRCKENMKNIYKDKTENEIKEIKEKRNISSTLSWKKRTKQDNMEMQRKARITKKNNWNDETYNNREQAVETMKEKYGYDFWMQVPENSKKYSERFKNFSNEDWENFKNNISIALLSKSKEDKDLWQQHRLKTISDYTTDKIEEIRKKRKQTWNMKTPQELHEIQRKRAKKIKHKYMYKNISFHSFDEMSYYIFIKETTNFNIIRNEMSFYLSYEYNGKILSYYPDFVVNNKIIEIKGLQFFENKDPTKKMINPYDRNEDGKYEAKYKCMIDNNVEIITDCTKYIDYVLNKYGHKINIE